MSRLKNVKNNKLCSNCTEFKLIGNVGDKVNIRDIGIGLCTVQSLEFDFYEATPKGCTLVFDYFTCNGHHLLVSKDMGR